MCTYQCKRGQIYYALEFMSGFEVQWKVDFDHRLGQVDQKVWHSSENSLLSHVVAEPDGQAKAAGGRNRDQGQLNDYPPPMEEKSSLTVSMGRNRFNGISCNSINP